MVIKEKKMFKELMELLEQWLSENQKFTEKGYREYLENRIGYGNSSLLSFAHLENVSDVSSSFNIDTVDNTIFHSEDNDTSAIDFFKDNSYMQNKTPKSQFIKHLHTDRDFSQTTMSANKVAPKVYGTKVKILDKDDGTLFEGTLSLQKFKHEFDNNKAYLPEVTCFSKKKLHDKPTLKVDMSFEQNSAEKYMRNDSVASINTLTERKPESGNIEILSELNNISNINSNDNIYVWKSSVAYSAYYSDKDKNDKTLKTPILVIKEGIKENNNLMVQSGSTKSI